MTSVNKFNTLYQEDTRNGKTLSVYSYLTAVCLTATTINIFGRNNKWSSGKDVGLHLKRTAACQADCKTFNSGDMSGVITSLRCKQVNDWLD